ncbi:MAG: RNA methyltransferase [Alphaproteobacteria bacterium]|nr:RNA methyltransferase [Alphaproteobacteria bacterium]
MTLMTPPIFILVRPQLGENVGAVARAMANFGIKELRLVAPRDGWPNPTAEAMAAHATYILDRAKVYATLEDAVTGVQMLYATTSRHRGIVKPVVTAREIFSPLPLGGGSTTAILFGPERTGLTNEDIAYADALLTIPVHPEHASLNIAQSAVITGYEWWVSQMETPNAITRNHKRKPSEDDPNQSPASKEEILALFAHLEGELDNAGFWSVAEKRPGMVNNIRSLLTRAQLTGQDVRTLHGIIRALKNGK